MANPARLSPNSCVISDRSSPSPAPAVPATTFEINRSRNGRRSMPSNAIAVSLANPMRSALGQRARPAASTFVRSGRSGSRSLDSTTNLRHIQTFAMREQPLDLGDDRVDVAELALQVRVRDMRVGG